MSEQEEDTVKEIASSLRKQCLVHMFLQSKSANIYQTVYNCLSIPNIMIGGILSITIFSTSNQYWKIATGLMAITSTILSSLAKHTSPGERAHLHCSVVREYMSILQELNINLNTTTDIVEKKRIIDNVRLQLHKLFDTQPQPSKYAVSQFERKYKKDIEDALYDNFEEVTVKNATHVQNRISLTKSNRLSSALSTDTV